MHLYHDDSNEMVLFQPLLSQSCRWHRDVVEGKPRYLVRYRGPIEHDSDTGCVAVGGGKGRREGEREGGRKEGERASEKEEGRKSKEEDK